MKKKIAKKEKVKKTTSSSDKQFFWLVFLITSIIIIVLVGPTIYHQMFNVFEYGGVKFEKIQQGQITFYHGVFPIIYQGNLTTLYNSYFRTDPRKNNISVNTTLSLSKKVFISLSPGVEECKNIALAQPQLANFIVSFPFVKNLTSGVNDLNVSKALKIPLITCKNASADSTVMIIQMSDVPSIETGNNSDCFILNVGKCQYLETVERYMMSAMAQINNISIS
jgi:hypothetical protein